MKKIILGVIVLISVIFGIFMYNKSEYVSSEAVFVATDSLTNIAFKLDGKIKQMTKEAGDDVKKGEILAVLQTKTLDTKLKEIEYKIKSQNQILQSESIQKSKLKQELLINSSVINSELNQTNNKIKALKYQILANQSKLKKLKFDTQKFYNLYKSHKMSYDKYDSVKTEYEYLKNMINAQKMNKKSLFETLDILNSKLKLNKNNYKNLSILDKKIATLSNQILSLNEIKKGIMIKLNDSELLAPFNGVIAKKFVNTDMVIKKGTFIYSIVNPKDIYIKVLLSETKLSGIKVGSKAIVKLDAFDKKFDGKVYKIMPVSASTFSLVPRDIASGEFTKLDQRFIVKIKIPYNKKLKIGMSGDIKIYK